MVYLNLAAKIIFYFNQKNNFQKKRKRLIKSYLCDIRALLPLLTH